VEMRGRDGRGWVALPLVPIAAFERELGGRPIPVKRSGAQGTTTP